MNKKCMISWVLLSGLTVAGAMADAAARVVAVEGDVQIRVEDGTMKMVEKGGELQAGDIVVTDAGEKVQFECTDGTLISMGENAMFALTSYNYSPKRARACVFAAMKGGDGAVRIVPGAIGRMNPDAVVIKDNGSVIKPGGAHIVLTK